MIFHWLVTSSCGVWVFLAVALIASGLYGKYCWTINELDWNEKEQKKETKRWNEGTPQWRSHQIWLNFLGSALGWWAFWVLLLHYEEHRGCPRDHPLGYADLLLVILAFLGMTGHLPHVSRYGSNLHPVVAESAKSRDT